MRRSSLLFGSDNHPTEALAAFLYDVQVPGDDLASINNSLQQRFFQKGLGGQPLERWELKEIEVNCPLDRIRQHLAACGFLNETRPSASIYTYAAWPGGLALRSAVRLQDLINAWCDGVRWRETIVFGGKRPLQPDKESFEKCCEVLGIDTPHQVSAGISWNTINPQTELEMMQFLWDALPLLPKELRATPITFVDAPMKPPEKEGGQPVRPSTEDTVQEWLRSGPKYWSGTMLLSSGAPYGMAQDEAFAMLLEPHGFTVETFGHAAPDLPIENLMREVAGCVNRIKRARLGS